MIVNSLSASANFAVVASDQPTSADWWQVGIGAFAATTTLIVAIAAWLTSRRAAKTAETAATVAAAAARAEREAFDFQRRELERSERLLAVEEVLRLHNHVELSRDSTSASTWWWDLEAKIMVTAERKGWKPVSDLWQLARDRYMATNVARDVRFVGEFKTQLFSWVHAPGAVLPIYGWIRHEREKFAKKGETAT
jgi:hypothetical protein